ncbi:MAG: DinB family protein [Actinomycetota bacterium]
MSLPVPDRPETLGALRAGTERFTALLRSVADPSRNAIGHWSIAETAAHTSHIYALFPELIRGGESPVRDHLALSDAWEGKLAGDPVRDPTAIAERIESAVADFATEATDAQWEQPKVWHGGIKMPTYALAGILIGEAMLHGRDIATSEGKPWDIDASHGILMIDGLLPALPHYVKPQAVAGLKATYDLRLRGGPRLYFTIRDGVLTIDQTPPGPIDCHISADPLAYVLVGYGRIGQIGPILTGKLVAWGRRPWLALRFAKLFHSV